MRRVGDARPWWLKGLVRLGIVLMFFYTVAVFGAGVVSIDRGEPVQGCAAIIWSPMLLGFGLLGPLRERGIRRYATNPEPPRLETSPSGEPALFVPYDVELSRLSGWATVPLVVSLVGWAALVALVGPAWGAISLAALALYLWKMGSPREAADLAGGVWFSERGIDYRHDGVAWSIGWPDVFGAGIQGHRLMVIPNVGVKVRVKKSLVAGRHRGRIKAGSARVIDERWLGANAEMMQTVIRRAVVDYRFRMSLATPEMLALVTGATAVTAQGTAGQGGPPSGKNP